MPIDNWVALSTVKLPVISPDPPRIGDWIVGWDNTLLSRMMANGLPTFSCVARPKRLRPGGVELEGDTTAGRSGRNLAWPRSIGRPTPSPGAWTATLPLPSAIGSTWLPAGARPCATCAASAVGSTSLNSSRAVWPISAFSASGSSTPGTATRIRRAPWLTTVTSLVPLGSIRRRTTSRATTIESLSAWLAPAAVGVRTMRVESTTCTSQSRVAGQP